MTDSVRPNANRLPPRHLLASAIGLAMATGSLNVQAQASDVQQLPKVQVQGDSVESYKVDRASSPKYTAPLRDTPQTITVVNKQLIEEQNLLSLRDVLSTVPGITFGAGEGGGGYGDSINLRGFSANNDIFVDGLRDSAQYTRTDPFNLEQVEVVSGASSVYTGVGSVGGSINLGTKRAKLDTFTRLSAGVGTDSYGRLTADTNQQITDTAAVRVNVMAHKNDVPGRDYEEFKRWGIAPTVTFGLDTDTRLSLAFSHQQDDNTPQYGVPFFNGEPLPGVDSSNYYGYHNVDEQEIHSSSLTATLEHDFSDSFSFRNTARWQRVKQLSVVDAVQGTWCLPSGVTPTGGSCGAVPPGSYMPSGPRGLERDTLNKQLVNQSDFTLKFDTADIKHTMVVGASFSHETFELDSSNLFRNPDGSNPYAAPNNLPYMDIYNPDSHYNGPLNRTLTGKTDGELDNQALYVFDTLEFSPQWQLNAGVRYEHNEGSTTTYIVEDGVATGTDLPAKNSDDLLSYRMGVVYKPVENGSIYFAYGNSKTPSKASVNGSCIARSVDNCEVDPETAENYELGTKWDLLDNRLSVTGAIFRNDRKNYKVADADPANLSGENQLDGQARVDGLTLGVAGLIQSNWAVYANYTYLDSEVLQGTSDYNAGQGLDYTEGDDLLYVPKNAFSLWTTYDVNSQLQLGYGVTYQDKQYVSQHSETNPNGSLDQADGYAVHRAMATYKLSRELSVQLNVNNLFDKEYYTRIRNNGWATPGDARSAVINVNYNF